MQTGHILLKKPFEAIKTAFKDYKLHNNSYYIEKKYITIEKGLVIAVNYKLAKQLNLETIGNIKEPTQLEAQKDNIIFDLKFKEQLELQRQADIAIAILTKNSDKINELITNK